MYTVSTVHTCITLLECLYMCIIYMYNIYLLYVAWADQRHHQCCIRHTEQFLNGTVLYDEGPTARRGRPNVCFSKVWRTQQRVRQPGEPQDTLASCFNPLASAKIGRSILTLAACDLTPVVPLNRPRVHYSMDIKLYRI